MSSKGWEWEMILQTVNTECMHDNETCNGVASEVTKVSTEGKRCRYSGMKSCSLLNVPKD